MLDALLSHLSPAHPWRDQIEYFDVIDSTNSRLKQLALAGAPQGTVLIADRQTGGRGRMGRSFHSPAGVGIYMSLLLRPPCPPEQLMHLTCAAAVAACDAIEEVSGLRPGIKWTNDLVVGQRKIAGILTELVHGPEGVCAVIGIGINCLQQPQDFPPELRDMAASLRMVTGQEIRREALCAALIDDFSRLSDTLLTGREEMLARYRLDCVTLGRQISILRADTVTHGTALDIDGAGGLIVMREDGSLETVASGEVSIRGMYGYL